MAVVAVVTLRTLLLLLLLLPLIFHSAKLCSQTATLTVTMNYFLLPLLRLLHLVAIAALVPMLEPPPEVRLVLEAKEKAAVAAAAIQL